MAVRTVKRRGERRLVIDIRYRKPDGTKGRYRHDAEVQNMAAARAEERRRLVALAATGSPYDAPVAEAAPTLPEERPRVPATTPAATKTTVPSFKEVAELYLATFAPSQLEPSTLVGYTRTIRSFLVPRIGTRPVDEINTTILRELDSEMVRRGVKPAPRRQIRSSPSQDGREDHARPDTRGGRPPPRCLVQAAPARVPPRGLRGAPGR